MTKEVSFEERFEFRIRQSLTFYYTSAGYIKDRQQRRIVRQQMRMISHRGWF